MLVFLRRVAITAIFIAFVLIAVLFSYANQEPISIDIGVARFENVSLTVALVCAFALGTVFGALCAGMTMLRMHRERRQLRKDLRVAEAELSGLRSLPLQDAG
jgi:lipopolysaccharide assembly protein A